MTVIDAIKGYDVVKLNEEFDKTIKSSYPLDSEQAQYVHSIVKELRERGEIEACPDEKADENYLLLLKKCKEVMDSLPQDAGTVDVVLELFQRTTSEELLTFRAAFSPRENDRLSGLDAEAPRPRPPRRKFHPALIAASVAVLLFVTNIVVTYAFRFNFLAEFARWSQETVYFVVGEPDTDAKRGHSAYRPLENVLNSLGIYVDLPWFAPDRFEYSFIEPEEPTAFAPIHAWFVDGNDFYHIRVKRVAKDHELHFEVNADEPSWFYKEHFLITSNMHRMVAIWRQDDYELTIQGDLTYEELTQILDSI
jgi:hypothetical protein